MKFTNLTKISGLKLVVMALGLVSMGLANELQKRETREAVEEALAERGIDPSWTFVPVDPDSANVD